MKMPRLITNDSRYELALYMAFLIAIPAIACEGSQSPADTSPSSDAGMGSDGTLGDAPDTSTDIEDGYAIDGSPFGFHFQPNGGYDDFLQLGGTWFRGGKYIVWVWSDPDRTGRFRFRNAVAPVNPEEPGSGGPIDYDLDRAMVPEGGEHAGQSFARFAPTTCSKARHRRTLMRGSWRRWSNVTTVTMTWAAMNPHRTATNPEMANTQIAKP